MEKSDLITHIAIAITAFLTTAVPYIYINKNITDNLKIFFWGTVFIILLALFYYKFGFGQTNRQNEETLKQSFFESIKQWVLKRGVLFCLFQTPTLAIFVGYFFRLTNYPTAMFAVLIAFVILPVWIIYRKRVSKDPDEPVHRLPEYVLYSLLLAPAFSIVRIPPHFIYGTVFWQPWSDFGSQYSGLAATSFGAFWAGALINFLHGIVLVLGYYILFKRHSLINALLFICFYFSSFYSFSFPFALVGLTTGLIWHAVVWWAHFNMALIAWVMPKFWNKLWPRFNFPIKISVVFLILIILFFPYFFAYYRAITWQIPKQHKIDQALFDKNLVSLKSGPFLTEVNSEEAFYKFYLQFGPRTYKTYFNASKAIDAALIQVQGRLRYQNQIIAWCKAYLEKLETPNTIWPPEKFPLILKQMDYSEIPVNCVGPVSSIVNIPVQSLVDLEYEANINIIGDLDQMEKDFRVTEQKPLLIQ